MRWWLALAVSAAVLAGAGEARAATVIVLHPGGWSAHGPAAVEPMEPVAERLREAGHRPVVVDYAPGLDGFGDVQRAYDAVRGPACVYGQSSGAHWALTLAAVRPDLRCVVAEAPPTDLVSPTDRLAPYVSKWFPGIETTLSPIEWAAGIRADTLLVGATDDDVVSLSALQAMARAMPRASLTTLPPGPQGWVHGTTTRDALDRTTRAELRWIDDHAR